MLFCLHPKPLHLNRLGWNVNCHELPLILWSSLDIHPDKVLNILQTTRLDDEIYSFWLPLMPLKSDLVPSPKYPETRHISMMKLFCLLPFDKLRQLVNMVTFPYALVSLPEVADGLHGSKPWVHPGSGKL